jgi:diguanylate cyclase (GGDEF) domain
MGDISREDVILEHIGKLINAPAPPEFPAGFKDNAEFRAIHDYLIELRGILNAFSKGELTPDIRLRGVLVGRLKALQANLLHLTWQIEQVAQGDFTQRVDFMGDFSHAFNDMVVQLDSAVTALKHKEEELTQLTNALQSEVEQKAAALAALRKSEANFRYMAEHDVLTGALNRRSFFDMALGEVERARKTRRYCSIVILDIDRFKMFNDTYGHLEGDKALKHVTEVIKAGLRQNDLLGRYGGEEFVILFPAVDAVVGQNVAERIRLSLASSPVRITGGKDVPVTVSMGLANIPPGVGKVRDQAFLEEVLRHADDALYQAKETRNRLVVSAYPDQCLLPSTE